MSKSILIIDDSASQRLKLKYDLEKHGYNVTDASDAEDALLEIKLKKPDLIVSDVIMPGMDGYELCKKIKNEESTKDIPVILLTSLSNPEDVIKGLESKTDNFITKPYDVKELLSRIQYVLMNDEMRHNERSSSIGIDIFFGGKRHTITSDRVQILDLLFSTFENSLKQNNELKMANKKLKELTLELKEKNSTLNKLMYEKDRFLSIAAHDIRNPANTSLQSYNILKEELYDSMEEDQKELFDIIKESSEHTLQLLNEILDLSVIESGELQVKPITVDIIKVIESVILLNKSNAAKKGISIEHSNIQNEIFIKIDKVKFEQVLNNLLTNAIKYSKADSTIIIDSKVSEGFLEVSVTDQGLGIPEKQQVKLFKPFSTAGVKTTGGETSTGLGLSIAKKIVEAFEGKIWFKSQENIGSTFSFKVPVKVITN